MVGGTTTVARRVHGLERELAALAQQVPHVAHLCTIPGIGLLNATALVACVGDVRRFPSGRHLASYLGLTPREHSSGNRRQLGAISKQGDRYLRTLLMHGARAVLSHSGNPQKTDARRPDRARHGFEREPGAWGAGRECV